MLDGIVWVFVNIGQAFVNVVHALTHPASWLDWRDKENLARFIYYGASVEFFFVVFTAFLVLTAVGLWRRPVMWGAVRMLEALANALGRAVAWAGLIMVLQQIMIVFLQRIFRVSTIELAPLGQGFARDLSWWSEELKLYNAAIICLAVSYTFVQGGHVRVDLIYAQVGHRARKLIDMFGALVFMMPMAVLIWLYAWFFMWRHLVVPNPSASSTLERLTMQARAMRWNVETTSFSPNGFDAYFLFKVLMVAFAGLVFLHAVAVFYRAYLGLVEGPEADTRHLDRDSLGEGEEAYEGVH
ncbi:MAG: TRAP transporter small permease subunit [Rhodobacteraceae bacterium]|nr:TRAP transporter small permease subunit [Paracoccaceae bacterium]